MQTSTQKYCARTNDIYKPFFYYAYAGIKKPYKCILLNLIKKDQQLYFKINYNNKYNSFLKLN